MFFQTRSGFFRRIFRRDVAGGVLVFLQLVGLGGEVLVVGGGFGFFGHLGLGGGGGGHGEGGGGGHDFFERGILGVQVRGALGGGDGLLVLGAHAFLQDGLRHGLEAPDQAGPGKEFQAVVGRVDFPPIEAVAGAAVEAVVVVVPAFAEADDGEDEAVAGVVAGLVAALAHEVGHGVDAGGAVEEGGG